MSYNNTTCAPERKQRPAVSIAFMMLGVLFCVCLIAANLLETKQIAFGPIDLTAGLIVFPVSYIINDCMVEVWGYRRARLVIWLGFAMNFLFVLFGMLATGCRERLTGMAKKAFTLFLVWHRAFAQPRSWRSL